MACACMHLVRPNTGFCYVMMHARRSYVHVTDGLLLPGQSPYAPAPPPPLYGAAGAATQRPSPSQGLAMLLLAVLASSFTLSWR